MAEFAVNNGYSESTKTSPFELVYGKSLSTPIILDARLRGTNPAADKIADKLQDNVQQAKLCLKAAQERQKEQANRHRREVQFSEGQHVLLSSKNIKLKSIGTPKLLPKWLGPYKILKLVGPAACQLELPPTALIHDVFHVSLLKEYHSNGRVQPPPTPYILDGQEEYEVERILSHRSRRTGRGGHTVKTEFLIKWQGYAVEHNTWEPETNVENAPQKLAEYWAAVQAKGELQKKTPKRTRQQKETQ